MYYNLIWKRWGGGGRSVNKKRSSYISASSRLIYRFIIRFAQQKSCSILSLAYSRTRDTLSAPIVRERISRIYIRGIIKPAADTTREPSVTQAINQSRKRSSSFGCAELTIRTKVALLFPSVITAFSILPSSLCHRGIINC